jgi:hypothetical protein
MIRYGMTLQLPNFNELVEAMKAYPPMANAEFYIASINCGNFSVSTAEEVRALAAQLSGVAQKFRDADTEYDSWRPKVSAIK